MKVRMLAVVATIIAILDLGAKFWSRRRTRVHRWFGFPPVSSPDRSRREKIIVVESRREGQFPAGEMTITVRWMAYQRNITVLLIGPTTGRRNVYSSQRG